MAKVLTRIGIGRARSLVSGSSSLDTLFVQLEYLLQILPGNTLNKILTIVQRQPFSLVDTFDIVLDVPLFQTDAEIDPIWKRFLIVEPTQNISQYDLIQELQFKWGPFILQSLPGDRPVAIPSRLTKSGPPTAPITLPSGNNTTPGISSPKSTPPTLKDPQDDCGHNWNGNKCTKCKKVWI
jgi:hypothetical protein